MNENLAYKDAPCLEPWREELIGGKWVAMAPPAMNHIRIAGNIYGIFKDYLRGRECEPIPDGAPVFLTDENYYIPDFMVVCDQNKIRPDGVHGAPDLVVEVLSPGTAKNDKGKKYRMYEAAGVREYWIVSPAERSVEQYLLTEGRFELHEVYSVYPDFMLARMKPEELQAVITEFKCSLYEDLIIRLEDIFYLVN